MFNTRMITVVNFACLSSCTLKGTIETGDDSFEVFDNSWFLCTEKHPRRWYELSFSAVIYCGRLLFPGVDGLQAVS